MMDRSIYNTILTTEYILSEPENKIFDLKSSRIKPSDLGPIISAFANAEGGTIVIGVSDKTRSVEGVNSLSATKLNDLISAPKNYCRPMPRYNEEFIDAVNINGEYDQLLLLHIGASVDQIIRTNNESTFLRIGDRTVEIKGDDLRTLEYTKSIRHFEDEICADARLEDLDIELLSEYCKALGAEETSYEKTLAARGFLKQSTEGAMGITNGAVLLFAKNIGQFYPNCRIRFLRYDGTAANVGTDINIIRDENIEQPILKIIDQAKRFVSSQLREFTALNPRTGKFEIVPEYPEFAWQEGLVNAVAHREYALSGSYIKVSMYDDRLEIESPGRLPSIVTLDNIRETRFSRNPRIARVLTEFGWVRELNEGVRRIYQDMERFFLDDPEYSEPSESVRLVLKNNIVMRNLRQNNHAEEAVGEQVWLSLDELERMIILYMMSRGSCKTSELKRYTKKSTATIVKRLNHLIELNVVEANGDKYDPNRTYGISTALSK